MCISWYCNTVHGAEVPIVSGLSCGAFVTGSKDADEAPRPAPPPLVPNDRTRGADPELAALAGEVGSVADGIAGIAGGLEALLARLRVRATHVTLRVELPPLPPPPAVAPESGSAPTAGGAAPGHAAASEPGNSPIRSVAVLRLAELQYAGGLRPTDAASSPKPTAGTTASSDAAKAHAEAPAAAGEPAEKLYKSVEFAGLTVELYQDGDEAQDAARAAADAAQQRLDGSCIVDPVGDGDLDPGFVGDAAVKHPADDHEQTDSSEAADELGCVIICSPDGVGCAALPSLRCSDVAVIKLQTPRHSLTVVVT